MPQIDEVLHYVKGLWLLVLGRKEGFGFLDITANGVWRSFAAILWCLPVMAVSWSASRLFYLANMPDGTQVGLAFFVKLLIVDLATWILPLVLIAVLAKPLGYADLLAGIIVTTNWLSVPIFYVMALPIALRLVIPGSEGVTSLLSLVTLVTAFTAIYRLLKAIAGDQTLLAVALTAMFILPSLMVGEVLQQVFDLVPP